MRRSVWRDYQRHVIIKDVTDWRIGNSTLHRCQNVRDGVSNHQPHDCSLNRLFRHRSKKTPTLRVTGFCEGNSPHRGLVTRKMFPFDDVTMNTLLKWSSIRAHLWLSALYNTIFMGMVANLLYMLFLAVYCRNHDSTRMGGVWENITQYWKFLQLKCAVSLRNLYSNLCCRINSMYLQNMSYTYVVVTHPPLSYVWTFYGPNYDLNKRLRFRLSAVDLAIDDMVWYETMSCNAMHIAQIVPLSFQGSHRTQTQTSEVRWAAHFSGPWVVTSMFA